MSTVGWLLILMAFLIARQVLSGRALNIAEDLSDAFLAITRGDAKGLSEVFARKGQSIIPENADVPVAGKVVGMAQGFVSRSIAQFAINRGKKAKGYLYGATGPDYYDCSGLMWRACQDGSFKGPRFTTETVLQASNMTKVSDPSIGDMVLWRAGNGGIDGHMGVITGDDEFYSAKSVRSGIGYAKISTFRKGQPEYVRFTPT